MKLLPKQTEEARHKYNPPERQITNRKSGSAPPESHREDPGDPGKGIDDYGEAVLDFSLHHRNIEKRVKKVLKGFWQKVEQDINDSK